ncbi:MAG: cobalamin-binding protein [Chloroflexi bacterium HGW-Chloroflexi-2]|jgi:5-methyltetrahydrofolate--homocysteine methyltransferase|nr:MAG: cobalamin-binding protein [Chloroflexi bacterium HGW-Chloroflexi-2]
MDAGLEKIFEGILDGNANLVVAEVQKALDAGMGPADILNQGMIAAMGEVGRLFEEGEYFVPEMLIAARAMQKGLELLKPYLTEADVQSPGKVAIGTVKGDLHDIGKNLVAMMLEGAAFEVIDLGTDVSPERFIQAVNENGAQIIAMSALLTTTMPNMKNTIEALKEAGLRDKVKVMIGGAPVTQNYADQIGADGFAEDASRAVAKARSLLAA